MRKSWESFNIKLGTFSCSNDLTKDLVSVLISVVSYSRAANSNYLLRPVKYISFI
jgi:hypothetical protein